MSKGTYSYSNRHRMHESLPKNNTMNIDITPDFYRIASEFYLSEPLPDNYLAMADNELDAFLEDNAWEPFQYWRGEDLDENIRALSNRMHKIAKEAANNANTSI